MLSRLCSESRSRHNDTIASVSPCSESCDASFQETIRCTVLSLDNIFYSFSSLSASCARGRGEVLLFHFLCGFFVSLGFVLLICCLLAFLWLILCLFGGRCGLSAATLCSLWSFGGSVVLMSVLVFCYRLVFLTVFILFCRHFNVPLRLLMVFSSR